MPCEVLAMMVLTLILVGLVGTQVQGWHVYFQPGVVITLADGQQKAESGAFPHLALDPGVPPRELRPAI